MEFVFKPNGDCLHLYSEEAAKISAQVGKQEIRRASHVEPTIELSPEARAWLSEHTDYAEGQKIATALQHKWWADMLPSSGPVLGPFETRQQGIDAEIAWLQQHHMPACRACSETPAPATTPEPKEVGSAS